MRANPSSSVRTPPNPHLQQSVDFASHQNGQFTLQQGKNMPTQPPQIQQQIVPCTQLQHLNQIAEEWNSSILPYHYEIITLPNNVQKCYGYGQRFADCYRVFRKNLIVRHRHRRIMWMSITGQPIVNRDFQYTYYHLKRNHIARKNYAFAQNPVVFATPDVCQLLTVDPRYRNTIITLDVIFQPTPV